MITRKVFRYQSVGLDSYRGSQRSEKFMKGSILVRKMCCNFTTDNYNRRDSGQYNMRDYGGIQYIILKNRDKM